MPEREDKIEKGEMRQTDRHRREWFIKSGASQATGGASVLCVQGGGNCSHLSLLPPDPWSLGKITAPKEC